jgi:hypothetical protein
VQIVSAGFGVQSTTLCILNVQGLIYPRATHAVFADTGAEMPGTYDTLALMTEWLGERGMEVVVVRSKDGPLEQYIRERSTPIPIQSVRGLGKRQCTAKWKIKVIEDWLRAQNGANAVIQLGISIDEWHRMKPSPTPWVTNRFPLIELGLNRIDCMRVIREAGLPIPPKSACYFCPFHRQSEWQLLAVYHPDLFDRACALEDIINRRKEHKGQGQVYLSSTLRPLARSYSKHQLPLPGFETLGPDDLCGGYCWV